MKGGGCDDGRTEPQIRAARLERQARQIDALQALAEARARHITRLRADLVERRLYTIWLDGEIARRNDAIAELTARLERAPIRRFRRLFARLLGTTTTRSAVSPVRNEAAPVVAMSESADGPDVPPAPTHAAATRPRSIDLAIVRPGAKPSTAADYLVPLTPGDEASDDTLDALAIAIDKAGRPELLCGDPGHGPLPGWSPELMLATMEIPWALAVRRDAFEAVGGWRPGFDGRAASYDLALRLTDDPAARVVHVPGPLVRLAAFPAADREAEAAQGARAISDALARRGIDARVRRPPFAIREGRPLFELTFPDDGPRIAIVIPTRDRIDLIRRCAGSLLDLTAYRNFRLVVVDDRSTDPAALDYLNTLTARDPRCRVIRRADDGRPFSYARLNNEAVRGLRDDEGDEEVEFVLFLNNDTQVIRPNWLSTLVGHGRMPGVGAVGARLLYPDGRVQHAGVVLGLHGDMPGHAFKLAPWWDRGPSGLASLARGCSAVTAACLLTRRDVFLELGGFDEARFAVGYNDIDYCLRLRERGLRTVYAPGAELLHFEGATRGHTDDEAETDAYLAAWGHLRDPMP